MQYLLKADKCRLVPEELEMINERVNFSLSRFNTLIVRCVISLEQTPEETSQNPLMTNCAIKLILQNANEIECRELGANLEDTFTACLSRAKRNIERQVKRGKVSRFSSVHFGRLN